MLQGSISATGFQNGNHHGSTQPPYNSRAAIYAQKIAILIVVLDLFTRADPSPPDPRLVWCADSRSANCPKRFPGGDLRGRAHPHPSSIPRAAKRAGPSLNRPNIPTTLLVVTDNPPWCFEPVSRRSFAVQRTRRLLSGRKREIADSRRGLC